MTEAERLARVSELEHLIGELRARLPRHTPPVSMLVEIDELDDELRRLSAFPDRSARPGERP